MKTNKGFENLSEGYLFAEVGKQVEQIRIQEPNKKFINLGIGDGILSLSSSAISAGERMLKAMGTSDGFRGYPPAHGNQELLNAIRRHYKQFGIEIDIDEIFVGDGAKCDIANLLDILGDATVLIPIPSYPVYIDACAIKGKRIIGLQCKAENGFVPVPDYDMDADAVILCSPNNPTGAVYNYSTIDQWLKYAREKDCLLIFDSAYEAFASQAVPHSVFAVPNADRHAVEIGSLSKSCGFTGVRCSYTVVRKSNPLYSLWRRRQTTLFNGVSHITQAMAAAALEDTVDINRRIEYYLGNAAILAKACKGALLSGGVNSPYLWIKCLGGYRRLLDLGIISTPGDGFGGSSDHVRLSSFCSRADCELAAELLRDFDFG